MLWHVNICLLFFIFYEDKAWGASSEGLGLINPFPLLSSGELSDSEEAGR